MEMAKKDRVQPTGAELRAADQRTAPVQSIPTRPTRRTYTAAYKLEILRQADAALATGEPGAVGALLRREGLYTSHLANWRAQRETGELAALEPKKRGPAPTRNPLADEVARLQRENTKLQEKLRKAEIVIDVQKKVAALLGEILPTVPDDPEPTP
jgi:transposase-like protein